MRKIRYCSYTSPLAESLKKRYEIEQLMEIINFFKDLETKTTATILIVIGIFFFGIWTLIKNNKASLQQKILIFLLIFSAIFLVFNKLNEDIKFKSLNKNYSLTKGRIHEYFVPNMKGYKGGNTGNSLKFSFIINNDTIENKYSENVFIEIPDDKPNLENEFLVIYDKEDFENSMILLNYPIRDSLDFNNYQKVFKGKIPDNVFRK